jgi:hypothetical protein
MSKKLLNKKHKVGVKEDAPKKKVKKPYKGMDTGRGHIALETTEKGTWDIKEKLLTRIKRYWDDVRFNR